MNAMKADPSDGVNLVYVHLDEANTLRLTGAFNVTNAAAIHAELSSLFQSAPTEIVIDMSGLTELDSAGLQLLLVLRRSVVNSRVHSCPTTLRDFIDRVGLTRVLT